HLVNGDRDFVDRGRCRGDLLRLMLGGFGKVDGRGLGFLGGGGHLHGGLVNRGYQRSQRLDREVDRVRDGAGDVLGNGRADGKVAFGQRAHFVQQSQNGFLVALVQLLRTAESTRLVAVQRVQQTDQTNDGGQTGAGAQQRVRECTFAG